MNKPLILDLRNAKDFQFNVPTSVLNKSQPVIKPKEIVKSEQVETKPKRKSKQVAKYIYGDNNMIILNPKWSRKA